MNPTRTVGPEVVEPTRARPWAQRLRNVLRVNATTSFVGGAIAAAIPGTLDRVLGTGHTGWVRLVGIGLMIFAIDVAVVAGLPESRLRRATPAVIGADAAWVLGSAASIVAGWYSLGGAVLVGVVAAMVAMFAVLQSIGWSALRGGPPEQFAIARPS